MSKQFNTSEAESGMTGSAGAMEAFGTHASEEPESDAPPLRAVALAQSEPSLVSAPLSFAAFKKPGPLGIARPPSGIPKSSTSISSRDSLDVKQEWSGITESSTWNINAEDLDVLSEDFPLERTHRLIHGVGPEVVAQRISETFRTHSIEAEYDCKKGKAKCKTSDYVSFRVRLFAGGENCDPVVVEVQRRCGSASSFMKSCRAILNAAEGKSATQLDCPKMGKPPSFKPLGQMKCLEKAMANEEDRASDSVDALEDVMNMLKSKQRDTNILGMENLVSLTDPIKTCAIAASRVSKCVVLGDEKYEIREEIVAMAERDTFESDDGLLAHADQLRALALATFSNGLTLCSKDGCLAAALSEDRWIWDNLIPSLMTELKLAPTSATTACSASECLHSIIQCSADARMKLRSQGIEEALTAASEFGRLNHAMLFEESSRCLQHYNERETAI